ncbi:hypothetical protein MP228_007046 [Amoeboaphelidium protococcarum]|nr:hypothetical protein MP228_007046 [Amoeboaphelidium protococcarum]
MNTDEFLAKYSVPSPLKFKRDSSKASFLSQPSNVDTWLTRTTPIQEDFISSPDGYIDFVPPPPLSASPRMQQPGFTSSYSSSIAASPLRKRDTTMFEIPFTVAEKVLDDPDTVPPPEPLSPVKIQEYRMSRLIPQDLSLSAQQLMLYPDPPKSPLPQPLIEYPSSLPINSGALLIQVSSQNSLNTSQRGAITAAVSKLSLPDDGADAYSTQLSTRTVTQGNFYSYDANLSSVGLEVDRSATHYYDFNDNAPDDEPLPLVTAKKSSPTPVAESQFQDADTLFKPQNGVIASQDQIYVYSNEGVPCLLCGISDSTSVGEIVAKWVSAQMAKSTDRGGDQETEIPILAQDYGLVILQKDQLNKVVDFIDETKQYGSLTPESVDDLLIIRRRSPQLFNVKVQFPDNQHLYVQSSLFTTTEHLVRDLVNQVVSSGNDEMQAFIYDHVPEDVIESPNAVIRQLGIWRLSLDSSEQVTGFLKMDETPFTPLDSQIRYILKPIGADSSIDDVVGSADQDENCVYRVYLSTGQYRGVVAASQTSASDLFSAFCKSLKIQNGLGQSFQWSLAFIDRDTDQISEIHQQSVIAEIVNNDGQKHLCLVRDEQGFQSLGKACVITYHEIERVFFECASNAVADQFAGAILEELASLDDIKSALLSYAQSMSTGLVESDDTSSHNDQSAQNSNSVQMPSTITSSATNVTSKRTSVIAQAFSGQDSDLIKDKLRKIYRNSSMASNFSELKPLEADTGKSTKSGGSGGISAQQDQDAKRLNKLISVLGLQDEQDLVKYLLESNNPVGSSDKSKQKVVQLLGLNDPGTFRSRRTAGVISQSSFMKGGKSSSKKGGKSGQSSPKVESKKHKTSLRVGGAVTADEQIQSSNSKPTVVNNQFYARIYLTNQTYKSLNLHKDALVQDVILLLIERLNIKDDYEQYTLVQDDGATQNVLQATQKVLDVLNSQSNGSIIVFKKNKCVQRSSLESLTSLMSTSSKDRPDMRKSVVFNRRAAKVANILGVNDKKDQFNSENPAVKDIVHILKTSSVVKERKVEIEAITKEGWLVLENGKDGVKPKNKSLWCYIENSKFIVTEKSASKETVQVLNLLLSDCFIQKGQQGRYCIEVVSKLNAADVHIFYADSASACDGWITALTETIKRKSAGVTSPSQKPKEQVVSMDDFQVHKVLGRGKFGKVLLCQKKSNGQIYAIKVVKKSGIRDSREILNNKTENQILRAIRHPFIVGLHYAFQTDTRLYLVLEYVNGGELFFHISNFGRFSEERVKFYTAELSLALQSLHGKGILYRDLKLENILLDRDGHVKLTDFGLSKVNSDGVDSADGGGGDDDDDSIIAGTFEYLAPEIIGGLTGSYAADWWALGVVMFEMLCGYHPFYCEDRDELCQRIMYIKIEYPQYVSADARDALHRLLHRDPNKRLCCGSKGAIELQKHKFFSSIDFDLLFKKELPVPFRPEVNDDLDVKYFDDDFLQQDIGDTPDSVNSYLAQRPGVFQEFGFNQDALSIRSKKA